MVKNSKKTLLSVAILLCLAVTISSATYGLILVNSNETHVDILYEVSLSTSVENSAITLNATVTNNGSPAAGLIVDFYCSYNGGGYAIIASELTDDAGTAQTIFTATANGGYDFQAIATVP